VWTLEQQAAYVKQGIWPTAGNVDPSAFIENLFSTWLYTGTGAAQTITNGVDLSGKGGMLWIKSRSLATDNTLYDTVRGPSNFLFSNGTAGNQSPSEVTSFNSSGFSLSYDASIQETNNSGATYASWTFREQAKFFDVVTYTGNGVSGRAIPHNLGSEPGCIIVKCLDDANDWAVYHRSVGNTKYLRLNTTAAETTLGVWNNTTPTSTVFTVNNSSMVNGNGFTYVAYLFAHNAGGFGLSGSDNVVSCGSFTTDSGGLLTAPIDLGYEPQWVMFKRTSGTSSWAIVDTMRGFVNGSSDLQLQANTSNAEAFGGFGTPTATGIANDGAVSGFFGSSTYIYIAIRRGPMAVPTTGTSVFKPLAETGTGSARTVNAGFPVDLFFIKDWTANSGPTAGGNVFYDRLRGNSNVLQTQSTDAEAVDATYTALFNSAQNGVVVGAAWSSYGYREYCFQRAPGFFDEVCYTGTGSATTVAHNLGAIPELLIVKTRSNAVGWAVSCGAVGYTNGSRLETINAFGSEPNRITGTPTATTFPIGTDAYVNVSARTYVAYLFATCPGVSKVGTYTGTGTLTTINCGFTGGARFVLIKKSSNVGSWFVWDTARGMVSGTDPSLRLNRTDAEENGDSIYSVATGFQLLASPFEGVNTNGDTYIFLAIA
jgi:hypothetical protein